MDPIRLSIIGTVIFVVTGIHATIDIDRPHVFVAVSLVEFAVGCIVCIVAFWRAIDRSRTETIGIGGLFFASGSAPKQVQRLLVGSFVVQSVTSIVFASFRLYTPVAFGVLSPMWSLGFMGLWCALHGTFPEREPEPTRAGLRDAARRTHRASMPSAEPTEEPTDRGVG